MCWQSCGKAQGQLVKLPGSFQWPLLYLYKDIMQQHQLYMHIHNYILLLLVILRAVGPVLTQVVKS